MMVVVPVAINTNGDFVRYYPVTRDLKKAVANEVDPEARQALGYLYEQHRRRCGCADPRLVLTGISVSTAATALDVIITRGHMLDDTSSFGDAEVVARWDMNNLRSSPEVWVPLPPEGWTVTVVPPNMSALTFFLALSCDPPPAIVPVTVDTAAVVQYRPTTRQFFGDGVEDTRARQALGYLYEQHRRRCGCTDPRLVLTGIAASNSSTVSLIIRRTPTLNAAGTSGVGPVIAQWEMNLLRASPSPRLPLPDEGWTATISGGVTSALTFFLSLDCSGET